MYRIVLDTNVLISAVIGNGKPRHLLKAILDGRCVLVTSDVILNEMAGVLSRPKFKMNGREVHDVMSALVFSSDVRRVKSRFRIVREDPDDDAIINTAYDGQADYIVSGDDDLLKIRVFEGIRIISVAEMLNLL